MRRGWWMGAALLATACATVPPLRPTAPAQPVSGDGDAGQVDAAGVKVAVRAGNWHGWPEGLQDRVTPVEVAIRNGSGSPLMIQPELFTLVLPDGKRYPALSPAQLGAVLRAYQRPSDAMAFHTGHFGMYPWPGFHQPFTGMYPYAWSGLRGPGPLYPGPNYVGPDPRAAPEGVLETGGYASVMVFFDVPADKLKAFTVQLELVGQNGQRLGEAAVPFTRAS